MKKYMILFLFCGLIGSALGQNTYDVFTYNEPVGYKKESKNSLLSYTKTDNKTGTYCVISLYAQSVSSGDLVKDFDNDWISLVATPLGVTAAPQKENGADITGWKTNSGGANFQFGGGTSMALLTTAKKDNANVAILIVTNSQDFLTADIEGFYASLKLGNPVQAVTPSNTTSINNNSGATGKPTSIIGEWSNTGAVLASYVNSSGQYTGDASSATTVSFKFLTNGKYEEFFATTTGFKTHTFYYKGTYKLNGNTITTTPTFYEHKLNTKLQPDNDPRNKKSKTFSYSFDFNTDKNIWGLRFKGDNDNFMSSDLIYKVGDAKSVTSTNTLSTSTTDNASTFNLLNGNGITGVWVIYNKPDITRNLQWNWFVFFNNGKSLQNLPIGGFYNLSNGAYYDETKNTPEYWPVGSYTFTNGIGKNKKNADVAYQETLKLTSPNQLSINSASYFKCTNVTGQKLNGSFTSYANANDPQLKTLAYGEKPVIAFTKDGKFNDEGLFNTYLFDGATNPTAAKPGSGTYELKDYSIIFKYDDGRVRQEAFTIPFSNNANDATIILISRAQINKIK
jgi:hypothetical protein